MRVCSSSSIYSADPHIAWSKPLHLAVQLHFLQQLSASKFKSYQSKLKHVQFEIHFKKIFLFIYWIGLFNCLILVVAIQKIMHDKMSSLEQQKQKKAEYNIECLQRDNKAVSKSDRHILLTSMRKLFHMLICIVHFLGIFYDRHLLYLCSFGMLIALILIEVAEFFFLI